MKIALIILHADRSRGGAETYTLDLADALHARGHQITLISSSFVDPPAGVFQVLLQTPSRIRTQRYRLFVNQLDAHLDATSYDVVHAMLPVRRCDVYHPHAGLAVAETRGAPLAALLNPRRIAMARIERALIEGPKAPKILCLSQYIRADVRKYFDLDETFLPVLFNAVDIERFSPAPRVESENVLALIVAQDFERKGLSTALHALAKLDEPRLKLRVVGRPDPAAYLKLAAKLGITERVEFAGPQSDMPAEYRAADFFVLPTRHDPCSLVVLEALACGLPVISTRFNGACEIMEPGVHGYIMPDPDDAELLAANMARLVDRATRNVMSQACVALRPQLSFENHLQRLMQIYEASVQSA